jgi:hypothetical protein
MLPALGVTLLVTIGLALWARWLGRLYGVPPFVRYLVWVATGVWVLGAAGSILGLSRGFGSLSDERLAPSERQRALAEGISEAMKAFAFSTGILLLVALLMLGLTWKYRWSAKPIEVPRDPPYR